MGVACVANGRSESDQGAASISFVSGASVEGGAGPWCLLHLRAPSSGGNNSATTPPLSPPPTRQTCVSSSLWLLAAAAACVTNKRAPRCDACLLLLLICCRDTSELCLWPLRLCVTVLQLPALDCWRRSLATSHILPLPPLLPGVALPRRRASPSPTTAVSRRRWRLPRPRLPLLPPPRLLPLRPLPPLRQLRQLAPLPTWRRRARGSPRGRPRAPPLRLLPPPPLLLLLPPPRRCLPTWRRRASGSASGAPLGWRSSCPPALYPSSEALLPQSSDGGRGA